MGAPLNYYHMLSNHNTEQLRTVLRAIQQSVGPEKIFLLGTSYVKKCTEHIFGDRASNPQQDTTYYLLVLTKYSEQRPDDELMETIEQRCRKITPVTVFLRSVKIFNKWLAEGQLFALQVAQHATLVYDAGVIPLAAPGPCDREKARAKMRELSLEALHQATEFFAGADLYTLRFQLKLAAFLLHQAMEHTCIALIRVATGFRASTHNIDKLVRYATMVFTEVAAIFPRQSAADARLFRLLQKAYIHSRYYPDFTITETQLCVLMDRVKKLQGLASQVLQTRAVTVLDRWLQDQDQNKDDQQDTTQREIDPSSSNSIRFLFE